MKHGEASQSQNKPRRKIMARHRMFLATYANYVIWFAKQLLDGSLHSITRMLWRAISEPSLTWQKAAKYLKVEETEWVPSLGLRHSFASKETIPVKNIVWTHYEQSGITLNT
jgi:hypothetical protein